MAALRRTQQHAAPDARRPCAPSAVRPVRMPRVLTDEGLFNWRTHQKPQATESRAYVRTVGVFEIFCTRQQPRLYYGNLGTFEAMETSATYVSSDQGARDSEG
jgi:hypothetical protein